MKGTADVSTKASDDFIGGLQRGEMAADNFFIMTNAAARDPQLHLADRGLLADMMSHKNGFLITEETLASRCMDGVKTVRTCLERLRAAGYVYRGARTRYPKGTRNSKGKDISGALGPYRWYVTDKPEEIAVILARYAKEQRALNLTPEHVSPGHDYMPEEEVVATCDDAQPVDNSAAPAEPANLPADRAGSPDLRKQGETAGQNNRPSTTVLKGRTKEDQPEEDQEENCGLAYGSETARAALGRNEISPATAVDGPLEPEFVDRPQTARADLKQWHGMGGMIGDNSPAARNARNAIVTGRRGPSWSDTRAARQRRDPAERERVRAELAQRPAGLPRATNLPLPNDHDRTGPTPPDRSPR